MKYKRVVVVGPESTGKTELASYLANHYNTQWVPEFARGYLEQLNRPYNQTDLLEIAKGQQDLEEGVAALTHSLLICDTDLLVIKIWSEFKYGDCNPAIVKDLNRSQRDLYLLTHIDLPWEEDPQREHPHRRKELFDLYEHQVKESGIPYAHVFGERHERQERAVHAINSLLKRDE